MTHSNFPILFVVNPVLDTEAPELECPPDVHIIASYGTRTDIAIWSPPEVSDNSGSPPEMIWSSHTNGSAVQIGGRTMYYYANDTSGNIVNCSFRVSLKGMKLVGTTAYCQKSIYRNVP